MRQGRSKPMRNGRIRSRRGPASAGAGPLPKWTESPALCKSPTGLGRQTTGKRASAPGFRGDFDGFETVTCSSGQSSFSFDTGVATANSHGQDFPSMT